MHCNLQNSRYYNAIKLCYARNRLYKIGHSYSFRRKAFDVTELTIANDTDCYSFYFVHVWQSFIKY